MMRQRGIIAVLAAVVLGAASLGSTADNVERPRREFNVNALTSKWRVTVGGSLSVLETRAAWSPKGLAGAVIILEDTLGLDEEIRNFSLSAAYRFNRRHSIEMTATDLSRSATRIIEGEIEWGDYYFRANGVVDTEFDTRIFRLKYRYDFADSGRLNAGFSVGLSTLDLALSLEGEARLDDDQGSEWVSGVVEGAEILAPVPVVGFFIDYAISPRWVVRFRTEAIDLTLGDHSGRVLQTDFGFEYLFSDLFGVGFGISGVDLKYRGDKSSERFGVDYNVKSFDFRLTFSF